MIWNILVALMFVFLPFVYLLVLIYFLLGWFVYARFKLDNNPAFIQGSKALTVIIPFRNESANLPACLEALKAQGDVALEVIFVDDHSDDIGPDIIRAFEHQMDIKLVLSEGNGKKDALLTGIHLASNPIVWTSDADCRVLPGTLNVMLNNFHQRELNMLCGLVQLEGNGIFQRFQQAESAALVGMSAFFLNEERPATCNGANLMFRKEVFFNLGGYGQFQSSSSGDDDLLMQKFAEFDVSKVKYLIVPGTGVVTEAEKSLSGFLSQRARWASKHGIYKFPYNKLLLVLMVLKVVVYLFLITLTVFFYSAWFYLPLLVLLVADFLMAYRFSKIIRFNKWLIPFLPFYQLYMPLAWLKSKGNRVMWKERQIVKPS